MAKHVPKKCPIVKNGRIIGASEPTIQLVSFQPLAVKELLEKRGEIRRPMRSFATTVSKLVDIARQNQCLEEMRRIYAWMARCMIDFGVDGKQDTWPFWAWHESVGVTPAHKYIKNRKEFMKGAVLVQLAVPSEFVILSDYSLFEVVMQGVYIASSREDHTRYFTRAAAITEKLRHLAGEAKTFPGSRATIQRFDFDHLLGVPNGWLISEEHPLRRETINSWRRIFNVDPRTEPLMPDSISNKPTFVIQATMPCLKFEWITGVEPL